MKRTAKYNAGFVAIAKQSVFIAVILAVLCETARGEFRTWKSNGGSSAEAELISVIGSEAVLRMKNGATKKVPVSRLSAADRHYISVFNAPELESSVKVVKQKVVTPYNRGLGIRERFTCKCTIKKKSTAQYPGTIQARLYVISNNALTEQFEVADVKQMVVSELGRGNVEFEIMTKPVEMLKRYQGPSIKLETWKGRAPVEFAGYVVVVTDELGRVISSKQSSSGLQQAVDDHNERLARL